MINHLSPEAEEILRNIDDLELTRKVVLEILEYRNGRTTQEAFIALANKLTYHDLKQLVLFLRWSAER